MESSKVTQSKCEKCGAGLQFICGEFVCCNCYGLQLLKEPVPKKLNKTEFEMVYDTTQHREIVRKKK